jgi:hypothetical protein
VPAAQRGNRVGAGEPFQEPVRRWRPQARPSSPRVRTIVEELVAAGERHKVVLGDLNEGPTVLGQPATNLATLVDPNGPLVEVYALPALDPGPRPGTFQSCGIRNRLDYIQISHDLAGLVVGGGIERRGLWGPRPTSTHRPSGTSIPRLPALIRPPQTMPPSTSTSTSDRSCPAARRLVLTQTPRPRARSTLRNDRTEGVSEHRRLRGCASRAR